MLSPPSSSCHSPTSPVSRDIYSACRALQSILTATLPTPTSITKTPCAVPQLGSPISLTPTTRARPKEPKPQHLTQILKPQPAPRATLKRRRSLSDNDSAPPGSPSAPEPSTPKRRRRFYPPTLPLGLDRADFDALHPHPTALAPVPLPSLTRHQEQETENVPNKNKNNAAADDDDDTSWLPSDDAALVTLILQKLRLRQSDWDDCARRLGRGKDSVGERWKMLLGEGEVGLRRGAGGRRRVGLGGMEFGGPFEVGVSEREGERNE